jgi:anti-sigma B factor antagonist
MDDALTLETRHEPGCAIVTAAGQIDISTVTALRECLLELAANGRPLVADLDQVTFLDASGLNALVAAANRAAAHGSSLHVICARPRIRQLFRVTGLNCRIPLARTLDDARDTLAAAARDHDHAGIVAAGPT